MAKTIATKLTVKEIEEIIISDKRYFNIRTDIAIPNLSWSLLPYEADLVIMNKTGYVTEFEIKRSFEDFKKDFKKEIFHISELIYRFNYVLPKSIEEEVYKELDKHLDDEKYVKLFGKSTKDFKRYPSIIFYDEDGNLTTNKSMSYLCGKHRKLFLEEKVTLLRLLSIRYWNLREKVKQTEVNKVEKL